MVAEIARRLAAASIKRIDRRRETRFLFVIKRSNTRTSAYTDATGPYSAALTLDRNGSENNILIEENGSKYQIAIEYYFVLVVS